MRYVPLTHFACRECGMHELREPASEDLARAGFLDCAECGDRSLYGEFEVPANSDFEGRLSEREGTRESELRRAAEALMAKLRLVHHDASYQQIHMVAVAHGVLYTGPTYDAEMIALDRALNQPAHLPGSVVTNQEHAQISTDSAVPNEE